jgi:hypothetical protein
VSALEAVARAIQRKDPQAAADALKAALEGGKLTGPDLDRGRFLLGRLLVQAKDEDAGMAAYALVSTASPLRAHASLRRATVLSRKAATMDEAIALLADVPEMEPFTVDRLMVAGEGKAQKGDHAAAAAAFKAARKGGRWIEASIRFAEEVAAMGSAGASQALEAGQSARRVRYESPHSTLLSRAEEAENKCKALLSEARSRLQSSPRRRSPSSTRASRRRR